MYYNVRNTMTGELMLGEGQTSRLVTAFWLGRYEERYPQFRFEMVETETRNPPWFPRELR